MFDWYQYYQMRTLFEEDNKKHRFMEKKIEIRRDFTRGISKK